MARIKNPTLIIGLGGTGFNIVSKYKSLCSEEFEGDIPSSVKFLCIDFDSASKNKDSYYGYFKEDSLLKAEGDRSDEWVRISSGRTIDYEDKMRNPGERADLRFFEDNPAEKKLLLDTIGSFDLTDGAGQKRVLGKIGSSYGPNYDRVLAKVKEVIRPLLTVNIDGTANWHTLTIHVVNSFSGGAGAGMFLDVLFMLSNLDILKTKNKRLELLTFNVMPDIFDGIANVNPDLIEPNAFAAITELEYAYHNVESFVPTHHSSPIGTSAKLPKANFLINSSSYNGSTVKMHSLLRSVASVMFDLSLSTSGLDTQWSNFQSNMSGSVKGKRRIFCSLGFNEVLFRTERIRRYALEKTVQKAFNEYNESETKTPTKEVDKFNLESLHNVLTNYDSSLLGSFEGTSFSSAKSELQIDFQSCTKSNYQGIIRSTEEAIEKYEKDLKLLVRNHYNDQRIIDSIRTKRRSIEASTANRDERKNRLSDFSEELETLRMKPDDFEKFREDSRRFAERSEELKALIQTVPKKYKSWKFWVKKEFYTVYVNNILDGLKNLTKDKFETTVIVDEVCRLFNNSLDSEILRLNESGGQLQTRKLNWLAANGSPTSMRENDDNQIFLESFFQEEIDGLIEVDTSVGRQLIQDFLTTNTDSTPDVEFNTLFEQTKAGLFVQQLGAENLYQLKDRLDPTVVAEIVNKLNETVNPLWDRADDDEISEGAAGARGNLITYGRVEAPLDNNGEFGEYFGRSEFELTTVASKDNQRQRSVKLELGLPAYLVKSIERYEEKFKTVTKDDPRLSVNYFAYNEVRKQVLSGDFGVKVFGTQSEIERMNRALYVWSFGWALGILFKQNQRIKVKVRDSFKAPSGKSALLSNRVYDLYKDLGVSADLIQLFNLLKEQDDVITEIEEQLTTIQGQSARDFLNKVAEKFKSTSESEKKQIFKTEKKAVSQLSNEEKELVEVKEQEALMIGCDEISKENSIKIIWREEVFDYQTYLRLEILDD